MHISKREKNILMLAVLVAAAFIISSAFPAMRGLYREREAGIENQQLQIERERRLIENTASWRERRVAVEMAMEEMAAETFEGETVAIVEANIQRELSQHARDSGITVSSTRLAETLDADGWLLVSQEMSFRTNDAANTVIFLQKLEQSQPRLRVKDLTVNRSRNQYNGSITVVGFTRSEGLVMGTE